MLTKPVTVILSFVITFFVMIVITNFSSYIGQRRLIKRFLENDNHDIDKYVEQEIKIIRSPITFLFSIGSYFALKRSKLINHNTSIFTA